MKHPVFLLPFLLFASPAWAQEAPPQAEAEAPAPAQNATQLDFSRSLMFKDDVLNKFMELYEDYQARRGSGAGTFTDTSVDLNIQSEVETTIDMEQVVFSLNSVLWDKGKWTIWVNGRKYEMNKVDGPILIGTAEFFIIDVGRENVSFAYHPGQQTRDIAQSRFAHREQAEKRFKATKVKGTGITHDGGDGYMFTLRPNQNFLPEFMVLTEGKVKIAPAVDGALENGEGEGTATDAMPASAAVGDAMPVTPERGAQKAPDEKPADAAPPVLLFPERNIVN